MIQLYSTATAATAHFTQDYWSLFSSFFPLTVHWVCSVASRHNGRACYECQDTLRWFSSPHLTQICHSHSTISTVSLASSGKALAAVIPVSRCHRNTLCYVILHFFLISSLAAQLLASLHPLSAWVTSSEDRLADCLREVWSRWFLDGWSNQRQHVGCRSGKTDVVGPGDFGLVQISSCTGHNQRRHESGCQRRAIIQLERL